jgi:hypothetical protein
MSVDLAAAVWEELKRYVGTLDRTEAADAMVNLLIDSNFDSDEIRDAFKGDAEIKKALNAYISDRSNDEEESDDEDADTDYDDDDDDY